MAYVTVFTKVGQRSRSRSKLQNLWYRWKGLGIRITHAKYESLICRVKKLWPMLKFIDRKTDGRKDRQTNIVITIGHPPSDGAQIIYSYCPS